MGLQSSSYSGDTSFLCVGVKVSPSRKYPLSCVMGVEELGGLPETESGSAT